MSPVPSSSEHGTPPEPPRKRMGVAVALAVLLGPLGLLYVNPAGALLMTIAAIAAGLFTVGVALLVIWPVCIIWAVVATIHFEDPPTGEPM